jgi:hypothetical protein
VKLRLITLISALLAMALPLAGEARPSPPPRPLRADVGQNSNSICPWSGKFLFFSGPQSFGYGWGVYNSGPIGRISTQYPPTSFNWIKITDNPPERRSVRLAPPALQSPDPVE